jgi:arginine-tRNA-protein transferase
MAEREGWIGLHLNCVDIIFWNMFVAPVGKSSSECGYCHSKTETFKSYGMWTYRMDCQHYQSLIDHGWRRSGCYLYKPTLSETCCPPYTIRLNCQNFQLSKSNKKTIKKIKKFIHPDTALTGTTVSECIDNAEGMNGKMRVVLEPASFSNDTFELYKKYQISIHHDKPEELTEKKFQRFLVDHPFNVSTLYHS